MNKFDILSIGISAAITAAVLSALCAAALVVSPDVTLAFFSSFMHGIDLNKVRSTAPITIGGVVYGVVGLAVAAFVSGVLFASVHNLLGRRAGS